MADNRTHLAMRLKAAYGPFWPDPDGWPIIARVLKLTVVNAAGERCHYECHSHLLPKWVVQRIRGRRAAVNGEFSGDAVFVGQAGWAYLVGPRTLPECPHGLLEKAGDEFVFIPDEDMPNWRIISVCRHELIFGKEGKR